jgi:hypothetical protein
MSVGQAPVPQKPRRRRLAGRVLLLAVLVAAAVFLWRGARETSPRVEGPDPIAVGQLVHDSPGGERCPLRAAAGPDGWPPGCWRPYSDASPFNRALPPNPRLLPDSAQVVERLTDFGPPANLIAGYADTPHDFSKPTYYTRPNDPLFTIHCAEPWGRCPLEGRRIRIPDQARPAAGGDGHMTVVDTATRIEYDFWRIRSKPPGGGTLTTSWGGLTDLDGDGLGSAAVAARYGNLAGPVRAQELAAGRIDHALFMIVHCDDGRAVYPATEAPAGGACPYRLGAPSMGARFQLDMSDAEIAAADFPAWKKTILTAMAHYGMFVGDTTGASWGIQVESDSTYTAFGQPGRFVDFARSAGFVPRADPALGGRTVYVGTLADGVEWAHRLRVVDPCVSQRTC